MPKEIAEARRKARALRSRVAHRRSDAKIDVDVGTLRVFLKVVDALRANDDETRTAGKFTLEGVKGLHRSCL